ncbi:hypothetical protein CALCODRAFT_273957 [Calocera cornea HHB12733]|uniref:Uncharacterized protein n=1 Tax=Calocera cornea HHB12733 TaxID=1353952 RepID=A0A165G3Y7_9BASI|nr:hypothetical protein CALCODRAFT_273957 [Calocera cornea HHB12733]
MFQAAFPLQGSEMHAQTPPEPGPLRPTAQGLSISNELHAITIIEAARQFPEFFPLIVRRPGHIELSMAELESVISHGNAFVFVPSAQNGLVRWSDCKRWSKSRQFKPFFRYFEEPGPRIRNDDEGNELKHLLGREQRRWTITNFLRSCQVDVHRLLYSRPPGTSG